MIAVDTEAGSRTYVVAYVPGAADRRERRRIGRYRFLGVAVFVVVLIGGGSVIGRLASGSDRSAPDSGLRGVEYVSTRTDGIGRVVSTVLEVSYRVVPKGTCTLQVRNAARGRLTTTPPVLAPGGQGPDDRRTTVTVEGVPATVSLQCPYQF